MGCPPIQKLIKGSKEEGMDNSPETIALRRRYAELRNAAIRMGDTQEKFDASVITQVMELAQVQPVGPKDYVHFANLRRDRFWSGQVKA